LLGTRFSRDCADSTPVAGAVEARRRKARTPGVCGTGRLLVTSLRAEYERDVKSRLTDGAAAPPVTEAELAHLPPPVQRYLRVAGVIGQPRVRNVHARMRGRIRSGRDTRWMSLAAQQYTFIDDRARFFYFTASML